MEKLIIIVLMVAMIVALFVALYYMLTNQGREGKTVKALGWRIGIWVFLLAFIYIGMRMGWIEPTNSINPKNHAAELQDKQD